MIRKFLSSPGSPFRSNVLRDATGRVILSPEQKEAIEWVKERTAKKEYIDKSQLKISTSRSSGPGGQNVNKVESKVMISFELPHSNLPAYIRDQLLKSHHAHGVKYMVSSDKYRSQQENMKECITRINSEIESVVEKLHEGSMEKHSKVEKMMKVDKEKRMKQKMHTKDKKRDRGSNRDF